MISACNPMTPSSFRKLKTIMLTRLAFIIVLLLSVLPLWCQVEPGAEGGVVNPDDADRMMVPPPVSGARYPTLTAAEEKSNFLGIAIVTGAAYNDNLVAGGGPATVSDEIYTVFPRITLDQKTTRQHRSLSYSPGFMLYQNTTQLDDISQAANVAWDIRLSPRVIVSVADGFAQNSNAFSQPNMFQGGITAGPTGTLNAIVIEPFISQVTNNASAETTYQFGVNGMIGGSFSTGFFHYPNLSQTPGLYNSHEEAASGFYSRRLTLSQYIGITDEYDHILTSPVSTTTDTNAVNFFYTLFVRKEFNASIVAGPQFLNATAPGVPQSSSWEPAIAVSFGWQARHANLTGSYSRTVTGGGGLLGAYTTNNGALAGRWVMAKTWNATAAGTYYEIKGVSTQLPVTIPGGRTFMTGVTLEHTLSEHLVLDMEYQRLHQSYAGVAAIAGSPDSDQVSVSLIYQFNRPLGR